MEEKVYSNIGTRIAKIRRSQHMTQERLAELLGVSTKHISHVENASSTLSLPKLIKFCRLSGCSLDYVVLGRKEDPVMSRLPQKIIDILSINNPEEIERLDKYLKMYSEITER
jgi:transcriptional regulator with XRE-family HTH domain